MKKTSAAKAFYELMSSMRFAISLLTILAIASVIGTVLRQNEPFNAYLNQFGPFWFPIFERLGLYGVYNAGWFLAILGFLVLSTSLCITRQTRPMIKEMRSFKEHAREASLRLFKLHAEAPAEAAPSPAAARDYLAKAGFRLREHQRDDGVLIAAKRGSWSRVGYFFAHGGMVIICLGGLLDGNLPLKLQMALGGKQTTASDQLIVDIPQSSRLGVDNWSFRGNVYIPEGRSADMAVLREGDGILLQELPFDISLKKFHIEHYDTGQPKRFASDIIITDKKTGTSEARTIEVNKPFEIHGVSLYQASFEDGGSRLQLRAHDLQPGAYAPADIQGIVGERGKLSGAGYAYTIEFTGFRAINVETVGDQPAGRGGIAGLQDRLGSGARASDHKTQQNVGPNFTYKLRDSAGQAREFTNYMLPVEQDGRWFMLAGMREEAAQSFRYLRIPTDEEGRIDQWFQIRSLLLDKTIQPKLAKRFALLASGQSSEGSTRLEETTLRTIKLFADKGFESLGAFIDKSIPKAEQERAAGIFLQVLEGVAWQAWQVSREQAGLAPLAASPARAQYIRDTLNAVSDAFHYGAPVILQLNGFEHVQASVLQATKSPGKNWVFLGSLLLTLGVFAMLYVRERRLFLLLKRDGTALLAMSANRVSMDVEQEFARHRGVLLGEKPISGESE
ncbi:cytochrome c biogenesis protein ResB [Niveibacterium sp. 24ML]|uniref:cytochrome c biogenesis protein ResB n=1 Tax=Niveibacterium sp. 24ML TaxID=2985512 RepID=UPI00226DA44F|nr:cytochrome c biogenesis protein ResB [Niveibacterium sp. 24ML]MCX9155019.1 cytochrome c biogenesis protein ResB [Niveibacterium sp. 24ML]